MFSNPSHINIKAKACLQKQIHEYTLLLSCLKCYPERIGGKNGCSKNYIEYLYTYTYCI